jgi:Transglycosylase SLT domain
MDTPLSKGAADCALLILFFLCSDFVDAQPLSGQTVEMPGAEADSPWRLAAEKHNVEPIHLYAIALHESRRRRPDGMLRPWPWTLHTPKHGALFFESYEAALERLTVLLIEVTNVDVGLMQINWGWNGHRAPDARTLLRPTANIEIAAQLLREHLNACDENLPCAIGRYHSPRAELGVPYAASVLAIIEHLRSAPEVQLALVQ